MAELTTLARPYAKAAFEFAQEKGILAEWSAMLTFVAGLVADAKVKAVLTDPKRGSAEITATFLSAADASLDEGSKNFLRTLGSNRRLVLLPEIAQLFEVQRAELEKTIEVDVASAIAVPDAVTEKLKLALEKRLGRQVKLSNQIDTGLIGGAVIRAGDLVIDGSVKGKLARLASSLQS